MHTETAASPWGRTRSERRSSRAHRQAGMSLLGLLFWAALIGFCGYLSVRAFPTVNEYLTIKKAVDKIAAAAPSTVAEIREAFERQKQIEYSIQSISGRDLEITKENDKVVISFAYDKEVPIAGPVYLVIKYEGRSR
jgi:Domain of unknown function (DUF4845)